jgi:hypothetical protein
MNSKSNHSSAVSPWLVGIESACMFRKLMHAPAIYHSSAVSSCCCYYVVSSFIVWLVGIESACIRKGCTLPVIYQLVSVVLYYLVGRNSL